MNTVLKRETKIAGILLLTAWLLFAVCNFGKAPENVLLKYPMIEAYGLLQKAMGKRELNGFDLVQDRLGYLHSGNFYVGFGEDQRKIAVNYRRLLDFCEDLGTKTGVIVTPMKVAPIDVRYPGIPYNSFLPEAVVLVGTPHYSTRIREAMAAPLPFPNVMYSYHKYIDASGEAPSVYWLEKALERQFPVFVTEWGIKGGGEELSNARQFVRFLNQNKISWCGWALSNSGGEHDSFRQDCDGYSGWGWEELTPGGKLMFSSFH